jgi:hypothetical protein
LAYPRSCDDVLQHLQQRHQPYVDSGWQPLEISDDAILHRLLKQNDIDPNTDRPKSCVFTNHGLSVIVEAGNFPAVDINRVVTADERFCAAVILKAVDVRRMEFEIHHDPHPDPLGNPQHPNHAQIVCTKTQGEAKVMKKSDWSVPPRR